MEYIVIDGEKKPFNLGTKALKEVEAQTGKNCLMILNWDITIISAVLYSGLKSGHQRDENPDKFQFDVDKYLDDLSAKDRQELFLMVAKQYNKQVLGIEDDSNIERGERNLKVG